MATIYVDDDLRDDLNLLKQIQGKKTVGDLIRSLLNTQMFNEEFFERIREKGVGDE